jgi:leader peptidase (prepilin peptidase)/N-methyltransferase
MNIFEIITIVFLGLAFGSFATALSYRLPRDISMAKRRRSQCPACHKKLGVPDLVPLFSWIFLKGKCRHCKKKIGWRYPMIELATLGLCLFLYVVYGLRPESFFIFALAPVLVTLVAIDFEHKIIPDGLNLSILLAGVFSFLANAAMNGSSFFMDKGSVALGGVILYGAGSWLLRQAAMAVMKREPMGLGDVKFYAAAGFWLGLSADRAALFLIVSGLCSIIFSLIWKKKTGDAEAPFGPSLVVAFITVLYFFPPDFIRF